MKTIFLIRRLLLVTATLIAGWMTLMSAGEFYVMVNSITSKVIGLTRHEILWLTFLPALALPALLLSWWKPKLGAVIWMIFGAVAFGTYFFDLSRKNFWHWIKASPESWMPLYGVVTVLVFVNVILGAAKQSHSSVDSARRRTQSRSF